MLNLFGAIANGIGRALPGYTNGYRMAIQDNWNDLNMYNQVQQGQINNAFMEDTFPLAYNMFADRANNSRLGAVLNTGHAMQDMQTWPGTLQGLQILNNNLPGLYQNAVNNAYNSTQMQQQLLGQMGGGLQMPQMPQMQQQQMPQMQQQMPQQPAMQNPNEVLNRNMNRSMPTSVG